MRDAGPESDDALAYFVPEAADLLDIMSRSLLALEQGRGAEDDVASLFRAIHTLKGAAYVVGHVRVGDLAHRIEDVLATARSNPGSLDPAAVDVIHAAVEAARCLLGLTDASSLENVTEVYEHALGRLETVTPTVATGTGDGAPARSFNPPAVPASPAPLAAAPSAPSAVPSRGSIAGMRLDLLVNLAGELVAARRRLEGRLRELDRVGEVLSLSRTRMAKAVGEFEDLHGGTGGGLDSRPRDLPPDALRAAGRPWAGPRASEASNLALRAAGRP